LEASNIQADPGKSHRLSIVLSPIETEQVIKASRSAGLTVNQLCESSVGLLLLTLLLINLGSSISVHGALNLMIYLDSPPADPNTDALFVYFFTHNLRSKLKGEWSGRLNYPGIAIGMSVLRFPVTAIAAAASKGKKDAILASALLVKTAYETQASLGALGTASARLQEIRLDTRKAIP